MGCGSRYRAKYASLVKRNFTESGNTQVLMLICKGLRPGDQIEITEIPDDSGWVWGIQVTEDGTGAKGWFPVSFTEEVLEVGTES